MFVEHRYQLRSEKTIVLKLQARHPHFLDCAIMCMGVQHKNDDTHNIIFAELISCVAVLNVFRQIFYIELGIAP